MTGPAGSALRLTALAGGNGTRHHRPLCPGTVHRARAAGLAGAGVLRGVEGAGAAFPVRATRLPSPSGDLPVAVGTPDTGDRVRAFPPQPGEAVTGGPAVPDGCEAIGCAGREDTPGGPPGAARTKGGEPL